MAKENLPARDAVQGLLFQGWLSISLWMGVGLLLEGLLGYKAPAYLQDEIRRELFRLGHAHGTVLGLLVVAAALTARGFGIYFPRTTQLTLRIGTVFLPIGFFLAGITHPEGDPGMAIWLVPVSAILTIYGTISVALSCFQKK